MHNPVTLEEARRILATMPAGAQPFPDADHSDPDHAPDGVCCDCADLSEA